MVWYGLVWLDRVWFGLVCMSPSYINKDVSGSIPVFQSHIVVSEEATIFHLKKYSFQTRLSFKTG